MIYPKLILRLLTAAALLYTTGVSVAAKETNPRTESLCRKFPSNSKCQDRQLQPAIVQSHQLNRQSFCNRFPVNSQCQQSVEIIKLSLNRSGEKDEWIQLEKRDDRVKLLHSTKVKDGLISEVLKRSVSFRIPPEVKAETPDTLTVNFNK